MRFNFLFVAACAFFPVFSSITLAAIPAGYTGKVFTGDTLKGHPQQIPGAVKAVFFDEGGEGVGYHDTRFIPFGSIRLDSLEKLVGMQPFGTGDQSLDGSVLPQGSYHLGWMDTNEWIKCTVRVKTAGVYNISLYEAVASTPNSQTVSVNDGTPATISNLPPTNGSTEIWHCWKTFSNVGTITLDTGLSVIKVDYITATFNADKVMFTLKNPTGTMASQGKTSTGSALRSFTARNGVVVSYSLREEGKTSLAIFDCNGRLRLSMPEQIRPAGANTQLLPRDGLAPGLYLVRLAHDAGFLESRLLLPR